MGKGTGDHQLRPSSAVSNLSIQTIDLTFPRAEPTLLEEFVQEIDPLAEFPFFKKTDIGRDESLLTVTHKI
jgi:hypothetical protein